MTPEQQKLIDQARRYAEKDEYVVTRTHIRNLLAIIEAQAELTSSYVQEVPDRCDRIVWRDRYYHLPISPPAQAVSLTTPTPSVSCVPDGWKLVPVEPTEHMLNVGKHAADSYYVNPAKIESRERKVYRHMLATAPSPTGLDNPEAPKS